MVHPVSNSGLFGSNAIEAIQQQFEVLKKQQPTFRVMVPSRQVIYTWPAPNYRHRSSYSAPSSLQLSKPSTSADHKDASWDGHSSSLA